MSERRRLTTPLFVALQVALAAALALGLGASLRRERAAGEPPPLRDRPLEIRPLRDVPEVVSDTELAGFLSRLVLRDEGMNTSIGHADHVLRLWGAERRFTAPGVLSGPDLLALLVDHRRFAQVYGGAQPPLLVDAEWGVRVRALEGPASTSHVDHLVATLAEVGTPLDHPIVTPAGATTYRAMLTQSLADFSLNQAEYEWSVLAYALTLTEDRFRTSEGQLVTFDRLAERIRRERLPQGVCSANHRLAALVILLRVDREAGRILSDGARAATGEFLAAVTADLVAHQHPDGFWNWEWPHRVAASREPTDLSGDRLSDRIIATGHALEWWSLAPEELLPPRETAVAAARWLLDTVAAMDDDAIQANISYLSHAGRALAQWRGRFPWEVGVGGSVGPLDGSSAP